MLNSNGFDDFLGKSLAETSRYYLIAWRPENEAQRKSNFSKIKITIAGRPELKVQLRRGYLGPPLERSKEKAPAAQVQVESTDVLGTTETANEDLRTAVSLGYKQTTGVNMQLTSSVQLSAVGDGKIDTGVLGAVFDSRGKAVGSFRQRLEVPRTRAPATPSYAYVNHQIDLPPGIYQVRVIAYERGTTRLNGAMEWIEIPKLKPGSFSISSLYVGEISEAAGSGQVGVNASGRFARSSRLRFTTYIYNAAHSAGSPQLSAQIKVLRGEQAVLTPPEIKISTEKQTNLDNITYAGEFPLSSLPPGSYVLQVTVTDRTATASASQQFRFTVH
jgi:hypothetical protein